MLDYTLHFLANQLEAPDWRRLGEHLPVEWIEQAVQRTDATSIRHRRLPAEQGVWLIVVLALYRHKLVRSSMILAWTFQMNRLLLSARMRLPRRASASAQTH